MNRSHVGQAPGTLIFAAAFASVLLIATLSFGLGRRSSVPRDPLYAATVARQQAQPTAGEANRTASGINLSNTYAPLTTAEFFTANNAVVGMLNAYDQRSFVFGTENRWKPCAQWATLNWLRQVSDVSKEAILNGGPQDGARSVISKEDACKAGGHYYVPVDSTNALSGAKHRVWFRVIKGEGKVDYYYPNNLPDIPEH